MLTCKISKFLESDREVWPFYGFEKEYIAEFNW